MSDTKRELNFYAYCDHTGMARHLEKMAARGWMLESIGQSFWRYRRMEPKKLRFSIAYYPEASFSDPAAPSEGELSFWDYCAGAGWVKIANLAQLHVFCHEDHDAVPIETDAAVQVDTMHRAMKKSYILSNALFLALSLLWLLQDSSRIRRDLVGFLASTGSLLHLFNNVLLFVIAGSALLGYFLWHRRAKKVAQTGRFLPTRSSPLLHAATLAVLLLILSGYFLSAPDAGARRMLLLSLGYVSFMVAAVQGTRALLRRKNVSRELNIALTLTVDVVLAILMIVLLMRAVESDWLTAAPENVETYTWRNQVEYAYHDDLPLYWEDLTETNFDKYVERLSVQESPLVKYTEGTQRPRWGYFDVSPDDLFYSITEVKAAPLHEACLESRLHMYDRYARRWGNNDEWYKVTVFVLVDAAPWGAQRAWRAVSMERFMDEWGKVRESEEKANIWLLDYGTRLVTINTGDLVPDNAQAAIVGEKLGT